MGSHFLSQLNGLTTHYPQLKLIAVTRSSRAISTTPQEPSIPIAEWETRLSASTHPSLSPQDLLSVLLYHKSPNRSILVDNTSSEDVAKAYPSFLKAGVSVVTPNKKAFSSELPLWKDIFASCSNPPPTLPRNLLNPNASTKGGFIYHEATVGAGLPILTTLTDLLATGDRIHRIEGVFSGTMSYLFNTFAPVGGDTKSLPKWSATVLEAKRQGYTEPDPRDDLNGADVARKLTILARLCGPPLPYIEDIHAFPVQSLIPAELASCKSADEFLARLPDFDDQMEKIRDDAVKQGKIVRFVGKIDVDRGEVKVGLEAFGKDEPVAVLRGSDNIVAFHTERYSDRPLVVQGGGAGGAVTAMGVTADLLRLMQRLGN